MYNKISLIGRLTRDPEFKEVSNTPLVNFAVATNEIWHDKEGQKKERAEFFECTIFGKAAQVFSQYTKKGKLVFVSGKMRFDKSADGSKIFPKVQVEEFRFLESNGEKAETAGNSPKSTDNGKEPWFFE